MEKIKNYVREICFIIVFAIITGVIFYIGNKSNINGNTLNNISELIFDSLIALVAIWISGYFILIQLYKNTYPMEIIEKDFLKKVKRILIFSIMNILIGILVLTIFVDKVSRIYFIITFILNMFVIFYNTYMINRTFTINTYIEKYFRDLEKDLENNILDRNKINEVFYNIYKFFDECLAKEEYYVCNNISEKNSDLFQKLIEYCNKLLLSENKNKASLAKYIFEKIIKCGIYQIKATRNLENKSFIIELFEQQEKNIKLCLKIRNIEWFQEYFKRINLLVKNYQNKEILEELYYINQSVGEELLKLDDIYFKWYIEELYELNISLKYVYSNINLKYFCKLLMYLLIIDSEEQKSSKHSILNTILKDFTKSITYMDKNVEEMVVYYQLYGGHIIEENNKDCVVELIEVLTNERNELINIERWNEFILYYLNITMKKWKDLGKENRKLIIKMILDLELKSPNINYYSFLPEYKKIIFENRYTTNIIDDICEEIEELLIRLIINNNINMFYYLMQKLKEAVLNLEKKDKLVQEKLFKVCIKILSRTINIENKKFIELTIVIIDTIIRELDKERKISDKFGKDIIEQIADMIIYRARINENDAINLIYLLEGFLEEENECYFALNKKKVLYKSIYNIGVSSIENNKENAVRAVSNALGWYIIRSIDKDTTELTNYIIDRTIDLFRIAQNMQISEKTLIFIMTLFTTVGTYCCKNVKNRIYLNKILSVLKKEEITRIQTAIELRTRENTMWDKLYEEKTEELTNKFLKELKCIG